MCTHPFIQTHAHTHSLTEVQTCNNICRLGSCKRAFSVKNVYSGGRSPKISTGVEFKNETKVQEYVNTFHAPSQPFCVCQSVCVLFCVRACERVYVTREGVGEELLMLS